MSSLNKPNGRLFTSNPNGLKKLKVDAELWQITRAGIDIPNATIVRELSPSPELYYQYITHWKGLPPQDWWTQYEQRFLKELHSSDKLRLLRKIYCKLLKNTNIVLICFCQDHLHCHRRLVGDFFRAYDVEVEELNPLMQLSMF
jgi:uncharacterized protein YeaO (DUF488 family)